MNDQHDQQQDQDDIDYEVGQEQLDAVDRMLEELDMDEQFDRVPAAFRIVERFEQQQEQQRQLARSGNNSNSNSSTNGRHHSSNTNAFTGVNGHHLEREDNGHQRMSSSASSVSENQDMDAGGYTFQASETEQGEEDSDDEMMGEPFGYIPLDQGDFNGNGDEDEDEEDAEGEKSNGNTGYAQMQSDDDGDAQDTEQGYDGYLRRRNRDGIVPVPVIPAAVQIDLDDLKNDLADDDDQDGSGTARAEAATELIPDDDLKTIAMVMSSFSLPAPDWAQSIPEDRWLPRIIQRAEAGAAAAATVSSGSGAAGTSSGTNNVTAAVRTSNDVTTTTATTATPVLATATTTTGTTGTTGTAASTSSRDL
ncbi:hypothetical protein BGW39_001351 [Mortierella sp. 14UC]|nr:hypothetical protein BGW39_001351 [Mortierella sp. 14UC]